MKIKNKSNEYIPSKERIMSKESELYQTELEELKSIFYDKLKKSKSYALNFAIQHNLIDEQINLIKRNSRHFSEEEIYEVINNSQNKGLIKDASDLEFCFGSPLDAIKIKEIISNVYQNILEYKAINNSTPDFSKIKKTIDNSLFTSQLVTRHYLKN